MPFLTTKIICTGCEYSAGEIPGSIRVLYQVGGGAFVESGYRCGWCFNCEKYSKIEDLETGDLRNEIQEKSDELSESMRQVSEIKRNIFSSVVNFKKSSRLARNIDRITIELDGLSKLLKVFNERKSKARCLCCFSENIAELEFDKKGHFAKNFKHTCGGTLMAAPNDFGAHFSVREQVVILSTEGELIEIALDGQNLKAEINKKTLISRETHPNF